MPESEVRPFGVAVLRHALDEGQLLLVYQPIFDLRTSAFVGVEALIRWRHPTLGLLGPDAFIATVESSELSGLVGRWTLETACLQGASWHDAGYRFRVSVNVSPAQWRAEGLLADVRGALETSRFDPTLLVLEVSRATLHADPAAPERLGRLAELGVHRAVDDFIPDAAELEALAALGVDVVKIDRSFVAGHAQEGEPEGVAAVASRAEVLGIQVIAAGIEDVNQRERLASERVSSGQGYGLSRPFEADELDRFLEDFSIFSGKPL